MSEISVRPSQGPTDYPPLVEIWRSAVEATHDFLSDEDRNAIESKLVSDYFPAVSLTIAEIDGQPAGFSGVLDGNLEMLFVDAEHRGSGIGTRLLSHAINEHGVNKVDVNEQNVQAVGFYIHRDFQQIGRSEYDEAGRPYPLLHLQLS
ncbi:acetyltransferase [Brevibacterium sp. GP-SGM9]|uniref:acetyltransferase n=1 Tax=unclassified Brevibacterium TaxID=2614124 RepID=UPI001E4A91AA|nr:MULTISPECIES: acetyltransferase [unclassified Brevibacterium]MCD1285789.1 acetyltransferase [Brevibacterium sp. CCUG 69071]MDK8434848.1 acetyltransferase [Brevibacterium sp. H-BE7]